MAKKFRENEQHSRHEEEVKSPWDFKKPDYTQLTSKFIQAGTDYGVGKRQPVGSKTVSKEDVIPMGKVETMEINSKTPKYLAVE
jgi:hypothetical protein